MVLVVSVDGLNPDALDELGAVQTPNFHRLIDEGAATLNARNLQEITKTLPNHTAMLTGRRLSGRDGHGVAFNNDNGGTLAATHGAYVPGLFDIAHDNGLKTAFLAEKDKFNYLVRSWDETNGAPDQTGSDSGRDKTDIDFVGEGDDVVSRAVRVLQRGQADVMFLHLRAPDSAGHDFGWMGSAYLDAVIAADDSLGRLLGVIDKTPDLKRRLTILLTSDHGGPVGATGHSDASLLANHRILFVAWGSGVARGADLYELNAGRQDPASTIPDYTGPQPIRNLDIAATALNIVGLEPGGLDPAISVDWPVIRLR